MIFEVPWPGMSTHESRGMPTSVAWCFAGFKKMRWIESDSECMTSSPGRAPLPTARITMGLSPVSDGV